MRPVSLRRMQATVHRFDDEGHTGSVLLDNGRELSFGPDVFARSGLRSLRSGQRVSVELGDAELTRLWIVGIGDDERIR